MSDFSHVKPGDKKIRARSFNTMLDAARYFQKIQQHGIAPNQLGHPGIIVPVQNNSGANLAAGSVLGISGALISPANNLAAFRANVSLMGESPDDDDHLGKFVVLREPIADEAIGEAFVAGPCAVRIEIDDPAHIFADVETGNTTNLISRNDGSARILYYADAASGETWAYVLLTGVPGSLECEPTES